MRRYPPGPSVVPPACGPRPSIVSSATCRACSMRSPAMASTYLASKRERRTSQGPVEDLRRWLEPARRFRVSQPRPVHAHVRLPAPGCAASAAVEALEILCGQVRRVAEAGRLCVGVERAADMIHAAAGRCRPRYCSGRAVRVATGHSRSPPARRYLAAITTDPPAASAPALPAPCSDATRHAVALKASLSQDARPFTTAERALFDEWLTRFIDTEP